MISEHSSSPAPSKAKKRTRNEVRVGAIRIRWYRLADGRTCLDLRGLRPTHQRPTFVDHAEALAEAQRIAVELNAGGTDSQALTSEDRAQYAWARQQAELYGRDLAHAITEWGEARRRIGDWDGTLADAAAAGVEVLRTRLHPIQDVLLELLASLSAHDFYGSYLRGIRKTGQALAAAYPLPIERIRAADIEAFLDGNGGLKGRNGKPVGARRRNNVLQEIRMIFRFARQRGYLPDKITEAGKVGVIKRVQSSIGIVSPAAMQIYLEHVHEHYLPWLVINAFSGVRAEEIVLAKDAARRKDPLRWEDFDWDAREICVRSETSKTNTARRSPISDNLFAWLQPWRDGKAKGPVCPRLENKQLPRLDRERARFIAAARVAIKDDADRCHIDLTYPHNGLRHSYGSYRMAILKDMGRLSYEMGNSIGMIKKNYNNPRPAGEGEAWFAIYPNRAGNVVQLTLGC